MLLLRHCREDLDVLLERHPRHRTAHASLISELLDLLGGASRSVPPPAELPSPREPLSESETRVLRYLPTDLSAREIADELFLSWYAVKTHMQKFSVADPMYWSNSLAGGLLIVLAAAGLAAVAMRGPARR
jgi:ATP/maltotriose-dependent transcriptional regulator MalT